MIITFIQHDSRTLPLTIGVSQEQADTVTRAMSTDGWHVLSKDYGPVSPVVDCLQVALLEVNGLPADAPIRVAVELGASAAMLSAPVAPPSLAHATRSRNRRHQRYAPRPGESIQSQSGPRQGKDVIH
jgi:hypothetical protein